MKSSPLLLALGLLLFSGPLAWSQGRGNDKDKDKKEYKDDKDKKEYKEKEDKDRYKGRDDERYKGRDNARTTRVGGVVGDILGRVVLPPAGTVGPRRLEGVPKGHYPPPGECRIWYPNRPAGHQPPPRPCGSLAGVRLEPGAFILHGDRAYDAEYDWRVEERRRPGSVVQDVLDILFPRR
jgi:hypothetical protein